MQTWNHSENSSEIQSKQKDHFKEKEKARCNVIALEVIKELSAKEEQQECAPLHHIMGQPYKH